MRVRIYRRYEDFQPNGWRSVREQTTDIIVQDHYEAVAVVNEADRQRHLGCQVGFNVTLWED